MSMHVSESLRLALLEAIARLGANPPTELVDKFLDRVIQQGIGPDVRKLSGELTARLTTFAMGNDAATQANDDALIDLLKHGAVQDKFIGKRPVAQQCYLLERNAMKVLLIIRPKG